MLNHNLQNKTDKVIASDEFNNYLFLLDSSPLISFILNKKNIIITHNRKASMCFKNIQLIGNNIVDLVAKESNEDIGSILNKHTYKCLNNSGEIIFSNNLHAQIFLSPFPSNDSDTKILWCNDITDTVKLHNKLLNQAYKDDVTDLPNRKYLFKYFNNIVNKNKDNYFFYIDLDFFRSLNQVHGSMAGDALLVSVAQLLIESIEGKPFIARVSCDEFVVIVHHCSKFKAKFISRRIVGYIKNLKFSWNKIPYITTVSVGGISLNSDELSCNKALSLAGMACGIAKSYGGNQAKLLDINDTELNLSFDQMLLTANIDEYFLEQNLELHYQPIVAIKEDVKIRMPLFEILVRIRDPDGNYLSTQYFIGAAEKYNKITKVERWIVTNALLYLSKQPKNSCIFSINISILSLCNEDFCQEILEIIDKYSISPCTVCFEITETSYVSDKKNAILFVQKARNLGIKFALDDFGSGYSSYQYLKSFPIDYIKIDGNFIKNIISDNFNKHIVDSITTLAKLINVPVIAEWVEDDKTYDYLKSLPIDYFQGYYLAEPENLKYFNLIE